MSENSSGSNALLPKVYDDVLSPSAREIGGAIHNIVRLALRPVNALVLTVEEAAELAMAAVAERIRKRGIAEGKVITPAPEVANAVILGLQTAASDPDLRELFFNLLTTAMVAETAATAHPAFVDLLRQLTPQEARIIQHFRFSPPALLLEFSGVLDQMRTDPSGHKLGSYFEVHRSNVTALGEIAGCNDHTRMSMTIDNLSRLGLFRIEKTSWPHKEHEYKGLASRPEIQDAIEQAHKAAKSFDVKPEFTFRYLELRVTSFGSSFIEACTTPPTQGTLDDLLTSPE